MIASYDVKREGVREVFAPAPPRVPATDAEESAVLSAFRKRVSVEVQHATEEEIVFDLIGVDASVANALRRIMLADVPTMAIERVYIMENTSVMHDEVLAHRLGLIPLRVDPRKMEYYDGEEMEDNTIVFQLDTDNPVGTTVVYPDGQVQSGDQQQQQQTQSGRRGRGGGRRRRSHGGTDGGGADADAGVQADLGAGGMQSDGGSGALGGGGAGSATRQPTVNVYSGALQFARQVTETEEDEDGGEDDASEIHVTPVRPVHEDILITKLRGNQRIRLEAHAFKGQGRDHAKWSPVATAAYRLLPRITFAKDVSGVEAAGLVKACPMNVFDIEDATGNAVAARPRECTMCRECIREGPWKDSVQLSRVADHFIFRVESTGAYPAADIVTEALDLLRAKTDKWIGKLDELDREPQHAQASATASDDELEDDA